MGKISEILANSREIAISDKEIDDYIDLLLSHTIKTHADEAISDEDFLEFQRQLQNKNNKA